MGNLVRSPSGPGSVVGDTHEAQLQGAYSPSSHSYTPSSHSYTPSSDSYTPSSDTHAASLTGTETMNEQQQSANGGTGGSADFGASPGNQHAIPNGDLTTWWTMASYTVPTDATTKRIGIGAFFKIGAYSGSTLADWEVKLFRGNSGGTALATQTITNTAKNNFTFLIEDTGFATPSQLYTLAIRRTAESDSAQETLTFVAHLFIFEIRDNHAANLTGSYSPSSHSYQAESHSYTPSSDSYTPSSDNHSAVLTGGPGACQFT